MLTSGQRIELTIEKPAAGGRMIARHDGQVLLVAGGIPGERVSARVERVERSLAFADAVEILERSPDRRETSEDPLCGGCLYAHVAYPRQLSLKAEVVADAFARIGRIALPAVDVAASPERGYRMRARLHTKNGRVGFYREGTHDLCDAAQTGQLTNPALEVAEHAAAVLRASGQPAISIELTENLAADQRALHVELAPGARASPALLEAIASASIVGCTVQDAEGQFWSARSPIVVDPLEDLTGGRAHGSLQRHVRSFFQANRYLLSKLVSTVLEAVPSESDLLDLYAGVGVFSVTLAGIGRTRITAVEGDASSGSDLKRNAGQFTDALHPIVDSVETFLSRATHSPSTVIVDPPRTGISKEAMPSLLRLNASRVIYVSCDPPTMARDAAKLMAGGYRLSSLRAFDLFPNTPHVECVGVLDR
jgi:tRNA/tmRNA/rRNA uracil-C5-methylase (TrmA/RlmC/RlmD family)